LIAIYDERAPADGYHVVTPLEFWHRACALSENARSMRVDAMPWVRQEGRELMGSVNDMAAAVREARDMGDPSDPAVQAFWARHNRSNSAMVGGPFTDAAGYPSLPSLSQGKFTGRTAPQGDTVVAAGAVALRRRPVKTKRLILPTH
jgi:hypothetical protein